MEITGWISATLLLLCGVPQAYKSIREGHSNGISSAFLWLWYGGEIFGIIYILTMKELSLPLLTNYLFNVTMVTVMLFYKYFPRKPNANLPPTA